MYHQIDSKFVKKFAIFILILILSFRTDASEIVVKQAVQPIVDLKDLYRENSSKVIHEVLRDIKKCQALEEALSKRAKTDPKAGGHTYFYVASLMRDLAHESECLPEEKKIAARLSAHYFVKALLIGNECVGPQLLINCPEMRSVLDQIRDKAVTVDAAILKLLEKAAHDFWVFRRRTIFYL